MALVSMQCLPRSFGLLEFEPTLGALLCHSRGEPVPRRGLLKLRKPLAEHRGLLLLLLYHLGPSDLSAPHDECGEDLKAV